MISACLKVVCFKDVEGDITEVPETDGVDVLGEFVTACKERDDVDNESGVADEADVIVVDFNVDEIIVGEFDADDDSEDDSTLDVEENDDNSDTSVDGSETTLAVVDVRADVVEFKDVVLGEAAEIVVVTKVDETDEESGNGEVVGSVNGVVKAFPRMLISSIPIMAIAKLLKDRKTICGKKNQLEMLLVYTIQYIV